MKKLLFLFLLLLGLGSSVYLVLRPQLLQRQAKVASTSSAVYFLHSDHLAGTAMITDANGAVVSRQAYYPFGATRAVEGDSPTERAYTGQVSDMDETNLYYYNARYYNPRIAKFTQADVSDNSINRYAYVGNNPVNRTDPSGHQAFPGKDELPPSATTDAAAYFSDAFVYAPQIEASGVAGASTLTMWSGAAGEAYPYPQNYSGDPNDFYKFLAGTVVASASLPVMAGGGVVAQAAYEAIDTLTCLYTTGGDPMCAAGLAPGPNPVIINNVADDAVSNMPHNTERILSALSDEGVLDTTPLAGETVMTIYKGLPSPDFQDVCPTCMTRAKLNPATVIRDRLESKPIESFYNEYYYANHSPFSSWTTSLDTAARYAQGGTIMKMDIPSTLVLDVNVINPGHTFFNDYEILVPGIIPDSLFRSAR